MTPSNQNNPVQWLEGLLSQSEDEHLEFKAARSTYSFDKLCEYASALANEGGGRIILGVDDQWPRHIVGTQAFTQPERTRNGLNDKCRLATGVEEIAHPEGRVLVFTIPSHPVGLPATDGKGQAWMRDGESLVHLSEQRRRSIYDQRGNDFTADVCPAATWSDLSSRAIQIFRDQWRDRLLASTRDRDHETASRIQTQTDQQVLQDVGAVTGDQITYAALILFGTEAALARHLANAEIIFEYRSNDAAGPAQERVNFREGFFLVTDPLWELINKRNDKQSYQDGLYMHTIATFSERPIRELILNAVSHRNYQHPGSIFVRQYPRRLVCESPGGFPNGINVDNVLNQQVARNRRVAELFEKCGLIERSGQGMDLMFSTAVREAKPLPNFDGTDDNHVKVTLPGEVQDPLFVKFLEQVGKDTLNSFSTADYLILDLVRRDKKVPEHLKDRARHLRDLNVLESVGKGRGARFLLSRKLYAYLGKPGQYTRKKGLDHAQNLQLLLNHLRDAGDKGARRDELVQVLPNLTPDQIKYRLDRLRDQGKVRSEGRGQGARWFFVKPQAESDSNE
jgi:ATP-dependent DNA helicase RecG